MLELLRTLATRMEGWLLLLGLSLGGYYAYDNIIVPWMDTIPPHVWQIVGMAWGTWAGWRTLHALTR